MAKLETFVNGIKEPGIQAIFDALKINQEWYRLFTGVPNAEREAMANCLRAFLPSRGIAYDVCVTLGMKDFKKKTNFNISAEVCDVILHFSKRTTLKELCETKTGKEAGKITFPDTWKDASIMSGMYFLRLDNKGRLTFSEEELLPILGYAAMLCAKQTNPAMEDFFGQVRISEATVSDGKTSAVLRMENGKITLT